MKNKSVNVELLFEEIGVWARLNDTTLVKYRCIHVLNVDKYFVKCSDFFYFPLDEKQILQLEKEYVDSLFHDALEEIPSSVFNSLEEAISAHEIQFQAIL